MKVLQKMISFLLAVVMTAEMIPPMAVHAGATEVEEPVPPTMATVEEYFPETTGAAVPVVTEPQESILSTDQQPAHEVSADTYMQNAVAVVLPETIRTGEDIELTWEAVENAKNYNVSVRDSKGKYVWSDYLDAATEGCSTVIPAGSLKQGSYTVSLTVYFDGGNSDKGDPVSMTVGAPLPGREFLYRVDQDGVEAYLYGYLGDPVPEEVVVPEKIDGAVVVGIYGDDFLKNDGTLKKVTIPAAVTYIPDGAFAGSVDLTICGYCGSDAEEFAILNGYTFEALDDGEAAIYATWTDPILVNAETTFNLYAPGAESITMRVGAESDHNHQFYLTENGATIVWTPEEAGSCFVRFTARVGGDWLATRYYPVTVNSLGKMPSVVGLTPSAQTIEPATEVTLRWENPENVIAPEYSVCCVAPGDTYISWRNVPAGDTSYTFNVYNFEDEGSYTMMVRLNGTAGYESSITTCTVEVKSTQIWTYNAASKSLVAYNGTDTDIIIPAEINGQPVHTLGGNLFANSNITSVTIPEGIKTIGYYAFRNCSSLTSVTLPSTLTSIEMCAFQNCGNLQTFSLPAAMPSALTSIGMYAFEFCAKLQAAPLPDSLRSIGRSAFSGCKALSSVVIPEGITNLEGVFNSCSALTQVTLPESLTTIGAGTFTSCKQLKTITIPQSVNSISEYAFQYVEGLTIQGYSGSVAETYAKAQGFAFVSLGAAQTGEISLALEKDTVNQGGYLKITVTAPDAEKLRLHLDDAVAEYGIRNGKAEFSFYCNLTIGEHRIAASQYVDGKWLAPCQAKTFTVVELGQAEIEPIESVPAGTPITVRWKPVEGVEKYTLFLSVDGNHVTSYSDIVSVDEDGFVYCQLTAEDLLREGLYSIQVTAHAADGANSYGHLAFEVTAAEAFVYKVNADGTATLTGYNGSDQMVAVPAELDGHAVVTIARQAFMDRDVVSVELPASVQLVEQGAFYSCKALETVKLLDAQATVCGSAFIECTRLVNLYLGKGVFAQSNAFGGCRPDTVVYGYAGGHLEEVAKRACQFSAIGALADGPVAGAQNIWQNETLNYNITCEGASRLYVQVIYPDGDTEILDVDGDTLAEEADDYNFAGITEDCTVLIRAAALVNGEWTAYGEKKVTVSVLRELAVPVIHEIGRLPRHLNHVLSWDPVENAQSYVATLYKGGSFRKQVELDASETGIALNAGTLAEADYTICVTAKAVGYVDSSASAEFAVYEEQLSAAAITAPESVVGGVRFDVSWTAVEFAEKYQLELFAQDGNSVCKKDFDSQTLTHSVVLPGFLAGEIVTVRLTAKAQYFVDGVSEQTAAYKPLYDYEIQNGGAVITGYNGTDTVLHVPRWAGNEYITAVGAGAFEGNTSITDVHFSGYVKSIGAGAFKNCTALRRIDGAGVKEIGQEAFYNCTSLTYVRFFEDPISIKTESHAFENTPVLKQRDDLMNITVNEVRDYSNNFYLGEMNYQEGITQIPARAHYNNSRLHTVKLPKSLKSIESQAFAECLLLESVTLYDSVTYIAEDAFSDSEKVFLYIYTRDMEAVSYVEQYAIDHGIDYDKTYDDPRYPCEYPEGTRVIRQKAHYEEKYLRSVKLPESVERIESQAFARCESLEEFDLYDGITSIAEDAFDGSEGVHFFLSVEDMETISYVERYAMAHGISCSKSLKKQQDPEADQKQIDTSVPTPEWVRIDALQEIYVTEIPTDAEYVDLYLDGERIGSFTGDGMVTHTYRYTFREFGEYVLTAVAYRDGEVVKLSWEKPIVVCGIRVAVSRKTAWTGEMVNFTVEAYPDAQDLTFCAEDLPFGTLRLEGNTGAFGYAFTKAGDRVITVRSSTGYTSDPQTLTILCIGQLAQPVLEAEPVQNAVNGLVCSWNTTENTKGYVLRVRAANGEELLEREIPDDGSERMSCTIPEEELNGAGIYQLYLMNYGDLYDQNESATISVRMEEKKSNQFGWIVGEGTCGPKATWTLTHTGVLTIKGVGAVTSAPWKETYSTGIKTVMVENGIISLCENAFADCTGLERVVLNDTLLSIGSQAFSGCTNLAEIALSSCLQSIGSRAFAGCSAISRLNVPTSVSDIAGNAFSGCKDLVFYCSPGAYAATYAIDHQIPLIGLDDEAAPEFSYLDYKKSYIRAQYNKASYVNTLNVTVSYAFKEDIAAYAVRSGSAITDVRLSIHIPVGKESITNITMLSKIAASGKPIYEQVENYTVENGILTIPMEKASGEVRIYMQVPANVETSTYAKVTFHADGRTVTEVIGTLYTPAPNLTISTDSETVNSTITVRGTAIPDSQVNLIVGDKKQKTTIANAAGDYSDTVSLGTIKPGQTYIVRAEMATADGTILTASTKVVGKKTAPKVKEFIIEHADQTIRLSETPSGKANMMLWGNKPFKFTIIFNTDRSDIKPVVVRSTKYSKSPNPEHNSMFAQWDAEAGAYVAEGFFETYNDPIPYVPGNLTIGYPDDTLGRFVYTDGYDFTEQEVYSSIPKFWQEPEVIVRKHDDNKFEATLAASDGSGSFDVMTEVKPLPGNCTEKSLLAQGYLKVEDSDGKVVFLREYEYDGKYGVDVADIVAEQYISFCVENLDASGQVVTSIFEFISAFQDTVTYASEYKKMRSDLVNARNLDSCVRQEALKKVDSAELINGICVLGKWLGFACTVAGMVITMPVPGLNVLYTAMLASTSIYFDQLHDVTETTMNNMMYGLQEADPGLDINWAIDPSGYLYDAETERRIPGATVTAYWVPYADTPDYWDTPPAEDVYGEVWDAAEWSQGNPMGTDSDGRYAWDVPQGWWRVKAEHPLYETAWSEWLPVPPPQTEVNIPMTPLDNCGFCGDYAIWHLTDGTLTISGKGDMYHYAPETAAPWHKNASSVKKIVLENRLTGIGSYAFADCNAITEITIGSGITQMGNFAFTGCGNLDTVVFTGTAPSFAENTFAGLRAAAYYPEEDATWTETVLQGYGGEITWNACCKVHTPETIPSKEANCTEDGLGTGEKCSECGLILLRQETVPALGHSYAAEAGGYHCKTCGKEVSLHFSQAYVALDKGTSAQIKLQVKVAPAELSGAVQWSVESKQESVISVDETGLVTARGGGTDYVLAGITVDGFTLTARCRIDVAATEEGEPEKIKIAGVQLGSQKVTSELYSTDYARLEVLLKLPQNIDTSSLEDKPAKGSVAIDSARFANSKDSDEMNRLFDLVPLDDRRLAVVPKAEIVRDADEVKKVKGSYKSIVEVTVDGTPHFTGELTLTVKKSTPKLTGKVEDFNSYYNGQSREILITGGTVVSITEDESRNKGKTTAIPDWLDLEDGILTLKEDAPLKNASGKVCLLVETEEWRIPAAVSVNVKNSYKAPGLKLSASNVTFTSDWEASSGAVLKLQPKTAKDSLTAMKITGIADPDGFVIPDFNSRTGEFTLKPTKAIIPGEIDLNVTAEGTTVTVPLTLKVKTAEPALKLSARSVTLNTAVDDSAVILVTPVPADHILTDQDVVPRVTDSKNNATDDVTALWNPKTGTVTVKAAKEAAGTYKVHVGLPGGKETAVTVRIVHQEPTVTVKAAGTLDLSFPDTPVTVTPTFRNYSGEIVGYSYTIAEMNGKTVVKEHAEDLFTVDRSGSTFLVWAKKGAELNVKNSYALNLELELAGGKKLPGTVSLKAKRTAVKLKVSAARVTLNKKVNDGITVDVSCTTKGYDFKEPAVIEVRDKTGKNKLEGVLTTAYSGGKLTLSTNEKTEYGATYKVILKADRDGGETPITVTVPAENKSDVTITTKLSGNLDVIRKNGSVTLTPTYKNCNPLAKREETLIFYRVDGKELTEVKDLFTYESNGKGGYTITIVEGAQVDHSQKYQVQLVGKFTGGPETVEAESKPAALSVKMGTAKADLTVKEIILFSQDKYSRGDFGIRLTDSTLKEIDRVVIKDKQYVDLLKIYDYKDGQFAIGFQNNEVADSLKGKTVTVSLEVYLKGNKTSKANASLRLKVVVLP